MTTLLLIFRQDFNYPCIRYEICMVFQLVGKRMGNEAKVWIKNVKQIRL